LTNRVYYNLRINRLRRIFGNVYLGLTYVTHGEQNLPLKVGQGHHIIVNDGECTNAGGGKILDSRTANAARTDDKDMGIQNLFLANTAYVFEHDMAGISVKLFVG
jgi:hypothetical protein